MDTQHSIGQSVDVTQIAGTPVISGTTRVGVVLGLHLDPDTLAFKALRISTRQGEQLIYPEYIDAIGHNCVVLKQTIEEFMILPQELMT